MHLVAYYGRCTAAQATSAEAYLLFYMRRQAASHIAHRRTTLEALAQRRARVAGGGGGGGGWRSELSHLLACGNDGRGVASSDETLLSLGWLARCLPSTFLVPP